MAHMGTRRQNVLRLSLARSRSRVLWSFLLSQHASELMYPPLSGGCLAVSPRSQEPAMSEERQWSDEE